MKLLITIPTFRPHGGVRVILSWAKFLHQSFGHEITLLHPENERGQDVTYAKTITDQSDFSEYDAAIITSPHFSHILRYADLPEKRFVFLQMMEHMFRPDDQDWQMRCLNLYHSNCPMFYLADWNREMLETMNRKGPLIKVKNAIDLDSFPVHLREYDHMNPHVLIESPVPTNPTKGALSLYVKVADYCAKRRIPISAYGMHNPRMNRVNFVGNPDSRQLLELYKRATILVKATQYDAQSTAPYEAMANGCVVVRGIIAGDDGIPAFRTGYSEHEVIEGLQQIIDNPTLAAELQAKGYEFIEQNSDWVEALKIVNQIITEL